MREPLRCLPGADEDIKKAFSLIEFIEEAKELQDIFAGICAGINGLKSIEDAGVIKGGL